MKVIETFYMCKNKMACVRSFIETQIWSFLRYNMFNGFQPQTRKSQGNKIRVSMVTYV